MFFTSGDNFFWKLHLTSLNFTFFIISSILFSKFTSSLTYGGVFLDLKPKVSLLLDADSRLRKKYALHLIRLQILQFFQ